MWFTAAVTQEYTSTLDKKEALTCVQELQSPVRPLLYCPLVLLVTLLYLNLFAPSWLQAWMHKLVEVAVDLALNSTRDKDRDAVLDLLLHLQAQEAVSTADLTTGLSTFTTQLEDLRCGKQRALPMHACGSEPSSCLGL
jgi:hypothetical protein